jgi:tetratricopeptide (TPR) repeat protein
MTQAQSCKSKQYELPAPFAGVFSEQVSQDVGFGATKRKHKAVSFWYVERDEDGETFIQPLNKEYVPAGKKRRISCQDLLAKFHPEPGVYTEKVLPKLKELTKTVARADRHRKKGELYSAEYEYGNALKIDEDNIRANFGLGLTFLTRGESEKARGTFEKIVSLEAAFQAEHKHLFNDFGIKLRENKMFQESLEYYTRALKLCGLDDHLLFNISRVHFELQNFNKSYAFLLKSLKINPDLEEAKRFKAYLLKRNPGLAAMDEPVEDAAKESAKSMNG